MTRLLRMAMGIVLAVGAMLLIGLFSQLPVSGSDAGEALLRMSWRLRSQEVGECPSPTQEELARLPTHMRNPDACVGPLPDYGLRVWVDGELLVDEAVTGRGARGDRPIYIFRDFSLEPGSYDLRVDFQRLRENGQEQDMGTHLRLEEQVSLTEGTVTLVTRAGDTGRLEVRRPR